MCPSLSSASTIARRHSHLCSSEFRSTDRDERMGLMLGFKVQHCVTTAIEIALSSDDDRVAKTSCKALVLLFREARSHARVLSTAEHLAQTARFLTHSTWISIAPLAHALSVLALNKVTMGTDKATEAGTRAQPAPARARDRRQRFASSSSSSRPSNELALRSRVKMISWKRSRSRSRRSSHFDQSPTQGAASRINPTKPSTATTTRHSSSRLCSTKT